MTETLAAEVATGGSTTVPAHMFYDIVRKLPDGAQIVLEGDRRPRGAGDPRRPLALHAADAAGKRFPRSRRRRHDALVHARRRRPEAADRPTQFAISTEETRYYLNGIYLHTAGSAKAATLRAVATDGHRLAQVDLPLPKGAAGMPGVIVPRKTVGEVQRLIEDNEAEVAIELSQGKIRFTIGDVVLTSKLIDGTFPDYGRVIPQNNDKELIVDKKDFEAAVDRVSTISSERGRAVKLALSARQAGAVGDQSGFRQRHRGARGRIRLRSARYRLQLALPARHRRPDRGRGRGAASSPIPARRR